MQSNERTFLRHLELGLHSASRSLLTIINLNLFYPFLHKSVFKVFQHSALFNEPSRIYSNFVAALVFYYDLCSAETLLGLCDQYSLSFFWSCVECWQRSCSEGWIGSSCQRGTGGTDSPRLNSWAKKAGQSEPLGLHTCTQWCIDSSHRHLWVSPRGWHLINCGGRCSIMRTVTHQASKMSTLNKKLFDSSIISPLKVHLPAKLLEI